MISLHFALFDPDQSAAAISLPLWFSLRLFKPLGVSNPAHVLAHSERRAILDIVRDQPGIQIGELADHFDFSRIAVHKHVEVLEAAALLISERDGRVRKLYFNLVPIQAIYERWTDDYSAAWAAGLTRFARQVKKQRGRHVRRRASKGKSSL